MPELLPASDQSAGDCIAPFIKDGFFIEDFYMTGRVAAQKGASVKKYQEAMIILGKLGTSAKETHVLGPDVPGRYWSELMTTSGDLHWNPRWDLYYWSPNLDDGGNKANWLMCGRPSQNSYGTWADGGVTPEHHAWRTMRPSERGDTLPPGISPNRGKRKRK